MRGLRNVPATIKSPTIYDSFNSMFDDFFGDYNVGNVKTNDWIFKKGDEGGTLTLNALGHNPENIEIEYIDNKLNVKSEKPPNSSELVNKLDYTFTIPSNYSEKDIKASFDNGMVTIKFGIKEERKPKRIKIDY